MTKPRIDKRHDSLFKQSFSDVDVARAALIDALPKKLLKRLDISLRCPVNASFIDDEFKQSHSDMVYEADPYGRGITSLDLAKYQKLILFYLTHFFFHLINFS